MLLKSTSNESILHNCLALAPGSTIVVTAESKKQVDILKYLGADKVLYPYKLMGDQIIEFLL